MRLVLAQNLQQKSVVFVDQQQHLFALEMNFSEKYLKRVYRMNATNKNFFLFDLEARIDSNKAVECDGNLTAKACDCIVGRISRDTTKVQRKHMILLLVLLNGVRGSVLGDPSVSKERRKLLVGGRDVTVGGQHRQIQCLAHPRRSEKRSMAYFGLRPGLNKVGGVDKESSSFAKGFEIFHPVNPANAREEAFSITFCSFGETQSVLRNS